MSEKVELLKTDVLGRVRMLPEKREAILDEFEGSGMSGQAFAGHIGVNYQTFATWVQKRRKARGQYPRKKGRVKTASPPTRGLSELALVEAVIESPPQGGSGAVEIESGGGFKVRLSRGEDVELAVQVIRALERC